MRSGSAFRLRRPLGNAVIAERLSARASARLVMVAWKIAALH
jgi:hypothetical protein